MNKDILTANNVRKVFMDCLFKEGESTSNAIIIDGITKKIGLNPNRIALHKEEIVNFLNELREEFTENVGGGYSFLEMCIDRNGKHWGEHVNCEELMILGMAIGKVNYLIPRDMWMIFPGGMPYLVIKESTTHHLIPNDV